MSAPRQGVDEPSLARNDRDEPAVGSEEARHLVERGREVGEVLEDVDREHSIEEPVVEREALLAIGDERRHAREARPQALRKLFPELHRVVLLVLEVLVPEVRAEPGADLQRAACALVASSAGSRD